MASGTAMMGMASRKTLSGLARSTAERSTPTASSPASAATTMVTPCRASWGISASPRIGSDRLRTPYSQARAPSNFGSIREATSPATAATAAAAPQARRSSST